MLNFHSTKPYSNLSSMSHKRKRSISESTSSSTSSFNSPSSVANFPSPFHRMEASPSHLHSRTLKRFRDNRPSENEVHQRTLQLLFSAQQQHQQSPSPMPDQEHIQHQEPQTMTPPPSNQQSLHRFWNISSKPTQVAPSTPQLDQPSNCDDCGTLLGADNGDEMDIDGLTPEDHACGACGRSVCFSCSVSNLGEQRQCLRCVGRKDQVGSGAATVC